ncbi:MAG TPA: LLM class flavin-dependent oxidoreductase [Thermoanaerobaculia bacterium]|nr:LLM class flavin-dependent oxidoreductase [Thermoanaerobaculia bacterium]
MRVGISITSAHDVADPREGARRMIDRARAAEAARLDSLFVGDHHATPRPYYQNTPILARLLAEWGDRPFGALYLLPLWHPVLLAEQVGTLASLGRGRFVLQCAIGPADSQFRALGVDPRHRPSRFEESLAILRRLWAGEAVSHDGRWRFEQARVSPRPAEPVEVWIGAAAAPAIDRAARLGDGWLAAPSLTPDQARRQVELYRERREAHGRGRGLAGIRRDVYVGESAEEARATAEPVVQAGYRGFAPEALVYGSAEQVAESFAALAAMGYSDVITRNLIPDPEKAVASTERLGRVRELVAQESAA